MVPLPFQKRSTKACNSMVKMSSICLRCHISMMLDELRHSNRVGIILKVFVQCFYCLFCFNRASSIMESFGKKNRDSVLLCKDCAFAMMHWRETSSPI